ncbi:hypothetical protein IG631_06089 [Alternaria alternata]|nr:hypothetical protein IG631_06089 [Alternaria alternata]
MFAVSLVDSFVPSLLVAAPSPPTTKPTPPHFTVTAAPSTSARHSARTSLQDFGDPCSTCCLLAPSQVAAASLGYPPFIVSFRLYTNDTTMTRSDGGIGLDT